MLKQIAISLRSLRRSPGFSLGVIVTLALGIGATVAIFTTVEAVLLRTLPFQDPDRLVQVFEVVTRENAERRTLSFPDLLDIRRDVDSLADIAAFDTSFYTLRGEQAASRVAGSAVTANFFSVLGSSPMLGPGFSSSRMENAQQEVVISHRLWQESFGGDTGAIGTLITLNERQRLIVGVMGSDFVPLAPQAELWSSLLDLNPRALESRGNRFLETVARLSPGATIEQARAQLKVVLKALEEQYPESNLHYSADLAPLREELLGSLRAPLLTLLAAVVLVLLVSCFNVASLWTVRSGQRAPDLAVRRALGAGSWSLLREHLTETVLLGLGGGIAGLGVAIALVPMLRARSPVALPDFVRFDIGLKLVLFAMALATAVGIAVGLANIRKLWKHKAADIRVGNDRRVTARSGQALLVVGEAALATLLAIGAGLFLRSLDQLRAVDPGMGTTNLVTANAILPAAEEDQPERDAQVRRRLVNQIEALPGIDSAALASDLPLAGGYSATVVSEEGRLSMPDEPWSGGVRVYRHMVSKGFFSTLQIPMLAGHGFEGTEQPDGAAVAVVSQALAKKLWGQDPAIGRRFKLGRPLTPDQEFNDDRWTTVIGVAANVRYRTLIVDTNGPPEDPDIYFPLSQRGTRNLAVAIRSTLGPGSLQGPLINTIQEVEPFAAVFGVESFDERVRSQTSRLGFTTWLLSLFAAVVLVLAGVGIYGVMAQQVVQRTREIGLRIALGSTLRQVVTTVLGASLTLLGVGLGVGVLLAAGLSRLVSSQLFGVGTLEPSVYLSAVACFALVGACAVAVPAMRVGRTDPIQALRND